MNLGAQSSLYFSNYGDYTFNILSFSTGFSLRAKEQKFTLGMSIHNLAISSSDLAIDLYPRLVISGSKGQWSFVFIIPMNKSTRINFNLHITSFTY